METESIISSDYIENYNISESDFSDEHEKRTVDWRKYIHSDPDILGGKPIVKGTRLSVDFILNLFANGWTFKEVFENYPRLSREALQSVFAYAGECLSEEFLFYFPPRKPNL